MTPSRPSPPHLPLVISIATLLAILAPAAAFAAAPAGYSEYYIPGDEDNMMLVLDTIGAGNQTVPNTTHSEITVTAWSDETVVYYDHWEDGYDFDRNNPGTTADETVALSNRGDRYDFQGNNIPLPRAAAGSCSPAGTCAYDGRDRIFVAGGSATVTRAGWTDMAGTLLSVAWEVYPVRPQLTTYILPFGEDLANPAGQNLQDFERVFALVQATNDNTVITVDYDGDGTADAIDPDRDGDCTNSVTSITIDRGEVFLLYNDVLCPNTRTLDTGTIVRGTDTLQVQYIIGDEGSGYEIRGLSAFPRGYWDDEYYAPVSGPNPSTTQPVDIYLHNPHAADLTITYETSTISGTFTIPANGTESFHAATGSYVPTDTSVYMRGDDVFWGVSTIDSENTAADWGYSLVPSFMLANEHFMGWAPGSYPVGAAAGGGDPDGDSASDSGIFIATAQDNVRIFIDFDSDGTPDQTYDMDRLQTRYLFDPDGDLSGANIWGTGPYTIAYGQNSDYAPAAAPAIDVGYTTIPGGSFIDTVLKVDKTVDPVVMPTAAGSQAEFTLVVDTFGFTVDDVSVTDFLPPGWAYVSGTTTVTLADRTEVTGAGADPTVSTRSAWRDRFESAAYNNNSDNTPPLVWATSWVEESDDGSPGAGGEIRIITDAGVTPNRSVLRIEDNDSAVARMVDLSGVTGGVLSFDYRASSIENADEYVVVQVCNNAVNAAPITCSDAGGWTQVVQIGSQNYAAYQSYSVDLTTLAGGTFDPNSATFALRFTNTGVASGLDVGDFIYIDDVEIVAGEDSLLWPDSLLLSMAANQRITISFTAETTTAFAAGDITRNVVEARGTRTVGSPSVTQTFITSDFAFNVFGDLEITKASGGANPLSPGDTFIYTVTVTNPAAAVSNVTGVGIYDTLPAGVTYVPGSSNVALSGVTAASYFYDFESGAQGFTVGAADGVPAMNWELGDPQSIAPPNAGKCGANCYGAGPDEDHTAAGVNAWGTDLDDLYSNNIDPGIYLYSPLYDFTGMVSVQLAYWEWLEIEGNTYDIARLQRRVGAGAWTNVWTFGTGAGPARTDTAWSRFVHDASAYAANQAQVQWRWTIFTDGSWQWGGWYIDDVLVQSSSSAATPPFPGPAGEPPNFVGAAEGYTLVPGQSLTLTFDVTVVDPLPAGLAEITNTASVTTNEYPLPLYASATNTVNSPSSTTASAGDRLWLDSDGDGVQDVGEPGLANVEVALKDRYGTPIDSATTDSNGNFLFTGVTPDTGYYVEVTAGLPAGLAQSWPAGHSDGRTDPFDLAAGDIYLLADLGYTSAPGTATLGDLVWSDADGDGFRDGGEPGIAGVTVTLYLDVNGDGLLDAGDTVEATTVTAAGGGYLLTGVTAGGGEDYFVYVDDSQAALAGYIASTAIIYYVPDVAADSMNLNSDFGFQNAAGTWSITDRVWYDADEDGQDDGETGIAGVTVDLLDASLNVIASTVTAADGTFSFTGVTGGGADYTVRVTDTAGVLTDYFATTAPAVTREVAVDNVGADVDYTTEPTEPNFGFGLRGTVGDTVFSDADGDGLQGPGEFGLSGVTVRLYRDENSDGLLDGGDTLLAAVVTDGSGTYLFSGLDDGDYVVSVATPAGYTYTTESPDDDPSGGEQQPVSIAGGGIDLGADFGYQAIALGGISGTLWNDGDGDGLLDAGETFFQGVSVALYLDDGDSTFEPGGGDTAVTTIFTDASGGYSFAGLSAGTYWVAVTDSLGVLTGYSTTYEETEGPVAASYDDIELVAVPGGDVTGIDFAYTLPLPTLVVLSAFGAWDEGGTVVVEWATAYESQTVGFNLYRESPGTGLREKVNGRMLPAMIVRPEGGVYRLVDEGAKPGEKIVYLLEEIEARGGRTFYGPFAVTALPRLAAPPGRAFTRTPGRMTPAGQTAVLSRLDRLSRRPPVQPRTPPERPDALRVAVTARGMHLLDAGTIASAYRIPFRDVRQIIADGAFALTTRGLPVAWTPTPDGRGIIFYGETIDSLYTGENVYWLRLGPGTVMAGLAVPAPDAPDPGGSFTSRAHFEEDLWPILTQPWDPGDDYHVWHYLVAGDPGGDTAALTLQAVGVAAGPGDSSVTLDLVGGSYAGYGNDHLAAVTLNGTPLGDCSWSGLARVLCSLPVPPASLLEGDNTLEVRALAGGDAPYSFFFVDSVELAYPRRYEAGDDDLLLRGEGRPLVTVTGFGSDGVMVFDVSKSRNPRVVDAPLVTAGTAGWDATFPPEGPENLYLAAGRDALLSPASVTAWKSTGLASLTGGADYVVIAPAELVEASRALAGYRAAQGYRTLVVDLQDVVDEFNDGVAEPGAVSKFLAHAWHNWQVPPVFALLVGDGSYDLKDVQGYGGNLFPPAFVATADGMYASDTVLGDVDNDGIAEIAVGRLPVLNGDEVKAIVEKIATFEDALSGPERRAILLADDPDGRFDFGADSDEVAALLPPEYAAERIHLGETTLEEARGRLGAALGGGAAFFTYFGHGAIDRLAEEGLLLSADVAALGTTTVPPVLTAMTCVAGQFSFAGFETIAEGLLLKPRGGAVAVWAPSGMALSEESLALAREFYRSVFEDGAETLGEAILAAGRVFESDPESGYVVKIYNLLGDPALRLK